MNELALFAGTGGGILGGKLMGWRTVCAVERDLYAASVLVQRQNDGHLATFPVWSDVCTFDGKPWRGLVDVVSGGFPCQDISAAGKGAGIGGSRSGLWGEMARIIGEVRPRFVFVENSPLLVSRGLGLVLADLAKLGYDARWGVVGADDAGAPHRRKRIWIRGELADALRDRPQGERENRQAPRPPGLCCGTWWDQDPANVGNPAGSGSSDGRGGQMGRSESNEEPERSGGTDGGRRPVEPGLGRVAHGVADRVDRLRAIGNGQVPAVVRLAWETLNQS